MYYITVTPQNGSVNPEHYEEKVEEWCEVRCIMDAWSSLFGNDRWNFTFTVTKANDRMEVTDSLVTQFIFLASHREYITHTTIATYSPYSEYVVTGRYPYVKAGEPKPHMDEIWNEVTLLEQERAFANHQHVMSDTPDGYGCITCLYT